jgi:GPH family glycoside/pentoside/hexuronide:cation symporter
MFAAPAWTTPLAAGVSIVTHFLFRSLYALVSVPYAALSARITRDSGARADLAAARMMFATTAAILVATATLPLAQLLGSGRTGWSLVAVLYGVAATVILTATAAAAGGLDQPTDREETLPVAFADKMRATAANWPLFLVLAGVAATSFGNTIFQKNLLYYFKYVVGDARLGGYAMGLLAVVAAASVPLWALVARRWGKKQAWLAGLAPTIAGLVLWRLADGHGIAPLMVALAVIGVGSAAYVVAFWSMLPDTVEFAEWRSGVRSESFAFGLLMLGQKAALGIGAGALGAGLAAAGYVAGAEQAPQTLSAMKAMMLWAPLTAAFLTGALISFYPISPAFHRTMVAEIAGRGVSS